MTGNDNCAKLHVSSISKISHIKLLFKLMVDILNVSRSSWTRLRDKIRKFLTIKVCSLIITLIIYYSTQSLHRSSCDVDWNEPVAPCINWHLQNCNKIILKSLPYTFESNGKALLLKKFEISSWEQDQNHAHE